MKNLKNIFAAIILLSTLTTTFLTASTTIETESNCFFNGPVLSLDIPVLNLSTNIQLLHSSYEAPVTIELSSDRASIQIIIDGAHANIHADGINPRAASALIDGDGINALVTGDGINALVDGDGINALIHADGINTLTVSQFGSVLYTNAR